MVFRSGLPGDPHLPTGKPGKTVDAELLEFYQYGGAGLPPLATVLRSRTDAMAVRGWFAASSTNDALRFQELVLRRDYGREVVLVFSFGSGCTSASGVRLNSSGTGLLGVELTGTDTWEECAAPFDNLAVFAVDKAKVPDDAALGGSRLGRVDPVSPAELLEFEKLADRPPGSARAAEVSQPDQFEAFVKPLPAGTATLLGLDGDPRNESADRRFAFVVSGCREKTAIMTISPERLAAEPVGGDGARCEDPEYYVAVFEIDGRYVPGTAEIG